MFGKHRPGFLLIPIFAVVLFRLTSPLPSTLTKDGVMGKIGIMGHCVDGVAMSIVWQNGRVNSNRKGSKIIPSKYPFHSIQVHRFGLLNQSIAITNTSFHTIDSFDYTRQYRDRLSFYSYLDWYTSFDHSPSWNLSSYRHCYFSVVGYIINIRHIINFAPYPVNDFD